MDLTIVDHPLIKHYLCQARRKSTKTEEFAALVENISSMLVPEVTKDLRTKAQVIETPLETMEGVELESRIVLVPILRAGLGMVSGFKRMLPDAMTAHLGLYRNETTLKPVVYYKKLPPDFKGFDLLVLDPMLATGGTVCAALSFLKELSPDSIRFVCLVAAPEGIALVNKNHPNTPIIAASLDSELNDQGYILPGLGDAGDRIFGTQFE